MNYLRAIFLIISVYASFAIAEEPIFGIVASQGEKLCVSFGEKAPAVGSSITLVSVESSQIVVDARLGEKTDLCLLLENGQIEKPYFSVVGNKKFSAPFVGVALVGNYQASEKNNGLSLQGKSNEPIFLRSCNSHEGFWFSAWRGQPLLGKQIWRQHYYLGYDIEPSCEEGDSKFGNKS